MPVERGHFFEKGYLFTLTLHSRESVPEFRSLYCGALAAEGSMCGLVSRGVGFFFFFLAVAVAAAAVRALKIPHAKANVTIFSYYGLLYLLFPVGLWVSLLRRAHRGARAAAVHYCLLRTDNLRSFGVWHTACRVKR